MSGAKWVEALEEIHSIAVGRASYGAPREHDGSVHCWCLIAVALREEKGYPEPGTDAYREENGNYARDWSNPNELGMKTKR